MMEQGEINMLKLMMEDLQHLRFRLIKINILIKH